MSKLVRTAWIGVGLLVGPSVLVGCMGDARQLVLDGPPSVRTDALGPVDGPSVMLSDGSAPEGILWTVSPDGVAHLDGTKVVADAAGEATVTGAWNGQEVQWTLVVDPAVQLLLVSPPAQLEVGATTTLQVEARVGAQKVEPGAVSWSSSDPAVLAISEGGGLTGVAPGTAYVIVKRGPSEAMAEIQVTGTD